MLRFYNVKIDNNTRKAVFIDHRTTLADLRTLPNDVEIALIVQRASVSPEVLNTLPLHIEQQDVSRFTPFLFERAPNLIRRLDFSDPAFEAEEIQDAMNENELPRDFRA